MFSRILGILVFLALSIGGTSVLAETYKWDLANEYGLTSVHAESDVFFIQTLEKLSDGRIKITHHPGASLGYKSKDQFDAVTDGVLPIANTMVGALRGIDPLFLLSALPFLCKSIDEANILWAVSFPYYEKVLKKSNQIVLYASPWPPSGIWSKKPIKTVNDVINLKIRTYDPNGTVTFKNAGASPIQLSWSDVVPQLGTGGINAVLTSAEGGVSSKFWDLLSCFSEINYASPLNLTHMNAQVYDKLPEDLKKAVKEAAARANDYSWKATNNRIQQNYKDMKAHKMTIVNDVSGELLDRLAQSGKPAIDEWLEKMGPDGDKILKEYRAKIKK